MRSTLYDWRRAQFALVAVLTITQIDNALAHGLAGERFFPATILTDDPFVADEISLPQVSLQPPAPDASQLTNIEIDLSKRITPNTGIVIGDEWQRLRAPGFTSVGGLGPLRTGAQYQLFVDGPRQALGLLGLNVTWGHTGRAAVGAPDFTTLSPTFDFGKGFGDIPRSLTYLRPFAITGNLGFDFPTQATTAGVPNPNQLRLRFRIQPSLHRMLREGHRAPPALQSADPTGGSILHDPDQPGAGQSDHGYDPARVHLGRAVFSGRRGGDHTGEPTHRTRLRRCRPAPLLSRRYFPAQHR